MASALLAMSVFTVIQLLEQDSLDSFLKISWYCFAVAIPLLVATIFVISIEIMMLPTTILHSKYVIGIRFMGYITALVGILMLFFHFSWVGGFLFLISIIIALTSVGDSTLLLSEYHKETAKLIAQAQQLAKQESKQA